MKRSLALLFGLAVSLAVPGMAAAGSERADPGDRALWERVRNSNDPADFRAYLRDFPQGRYVAEADRRLARLLRGDHEPAPGPAPPRGYAPVPGPTGVKLTVMPVYRSGDPVAVRFDGLPPGIHDLRIFPVSGGRPAGRPIESQRTEPFFRDNGTSSTGQIDFPPLPPGSYEARVFVRERGRGRASEPAAVASFEVRRG
jgi:hypothetical protein